MKKLALAAFVAVAALGTASPSAAATPCWKQLINDWYDGRIDKVYPVKCYQQALSNVPEDQRQYGTLEADLTRALQAAIRSRGSGGNGGNGSGGSTGPSGTGTGTRGVPAGGFGRRTGPLSQSAAADPTLVPKLPGREEPKGAFRRAIDYFGPDNVDSVPLPLIFLAALALLLLAAGGAGVVARRVQARRAAVPPAPPGDLGP